MEMKWLYGIFAFITFVTLTNAARNNIPRLYNSHRYRNPPSNYNNNNNNNNYNYNSNNRDDGGFGSGSGLSTSQQQWRRSQQQPWQQQPQQQQFPWKNHYFFRETKNNRTCGKFLSQRVSNVCGGCPPDGLTSIRKRAGKRSIADPKIVEACCISQCPDDVIKTLACNECNI